MKVFIGLGSNLGNRSENIRSAIEALSNVPEIKLVKVSSVIESDPQGGPPQPKYFNCVAEIDTILPAREVLTVLNDIENKLGRVRTVKNGPRTIDLDILLYGDEKIDEPGLKIPHPRMLEREFVMRPLFEIEPDIGELVNKLV